MPQAQRGNCHVILDTVLQGDALEVLKTLPDESVNCCICSPPYFQLRSYVDANNPIKAHEIGIEQTPQEYVANLVAIFREVKRVLRCDGTFWLNLGDSYNGSGKGGGTGEFSQKQVTNKGSYTDVKPSRLKELPAKNLFGIPWRVAFALQDDGWILRSDIIWHKGNSMPESVRDRPTRAHEYIFLFAKSPKYYYDADSIKTPVKPTSIKRLGRAVKATHKNVNGAPGQTVHSMAKPRPNVNKQDGVGKRQYSTFNERYDGQVVPMANRRSVWVIPTQGTKFKHFASYPEALVEPMILAGCPEGGVVLDPFAGSGTTLLVARNLKRHFIGVELNPEYIKICHERLRKPFEKHHIQKDDPLEDLPLFSPDLNTGTADANGN